MSVHIISRDVIYHAFHIMEYKYCSIILCMLQFYFVYSKTKC